MSERASFVTQFTDCDDCFKSAARILVRDGKYLKGQVIGPWAGCSATHMPIIAGKIGALSPEELVVYADHEIRFELERAICHTLVFAVITADGEVKAFVCEPAEM